MTLYLIEQLSLALTGTSTTTSFSRPLLFLVWNAAVPSYGERKGSLRVSPVVESTVPTAVVSLYKSSHYS